MSGAREGHAEMGLRRFRPYPEYKDSGHPWIQSVPSHWQVQRLKHVARLNPTVVGSRFRADDPIRFVSISEVDSDGKIAMPDEIPFWMAPAAAQLIASDGDSVISRVRTYLRAIAHLDSPPENLVLSNGFVVVRPSEDLDRRFLTHSLRSEPFVGDVVSRSSGVTYPAISPPGIGDITICLPPRREQEQIAAYLDREVGRIGTLIRNKLGLITLLREKRAALITQLVTRGQVTGCVPTKPSGVSWLGEIPRHWHVAKLKRIATVEYGLGGELDRSLEEGTPIISLPNLSIDGELDLSEVPNARVPEAAISSLLLRKGDLLFNWRNGSSEHVGKTALFNAAGEYTHVSFLLRVRILPAEALPRYIHRFLNSLRFTGFFSSTKAGVNNTFNQSELRELPVLLPPAREQASIAEELDRRIPEIDQLSAGVSNAIAALRELRGALITAAVTGKIDVCAA